MAPTPWPLGDVTVIPHYGDVIMGAMASQITNLTIVYSAAYSGAGQRKHQSSASLAFVREIHRWPMNSPHEWPITRKMFPFDDVIMKIVTCELILENCSLGIRCVIALMRIPMKLILRKSTLVQVMAWCRLA